MIAPAPLANECFSTLTIGQVIKPMSSSEGSWAPTTMTITGTGSVIHGVQINGWNFASTPTSGGVTQTSGSAVSGTSSSSSSGTGGANSTTPNGGLSSGAKAGIGIAVAVGVIGICCMAAAFLFYRKRRNTPSKGHKEFNTPPDYYAHSPATQYGEVPNVQKYSGAPHAPQQYMAPPVEVSGESKPTPPVEIG